MKKAAKKSEQTVARGYHYDVIVSPVITEKSTRASEHNKVMFNVRLDAGKKDISVNTLVRLGKEKRFRGTTGKLSDTKKAIITLAEGQTINLEGGVK
mgnify:CR=1 FL=1